MKKICLYVLVVLYLITFTLSSKAEPSCKLYKFGNNKKVYVYTLDFPFSQVDTFKLYRFIEELLDVANILPVERGFACINYLKGFYFRFNFLKK